MPFMSMTDNAKFYVNNNEFKYHIEETLLKNMLDEVGLFSSENIEITYYDLEKDYKYPMICVKRNKSTIPIEEQREKYKNGKYIDGIK